MPNVFPFPLADARVLIAEVEAIAASKGLTMQEICSRAGIAASTVCRAKAGRNEPRISTLARLLESARAA